MEDRALRSPSVPKQSLELKTKILEVGGQGFLRNKRGLVTKGDVHVPYVDVVDLERSVKPKDNAVPNHYFLFSIDI